MSAPRRPWVCAPEEAGTPNLVQSVAEVMHGERADMTVSNGEYAQVPAMIRAWRLCGPSTAQGRRQMDDIARVTLPLAEHIARRFAGRGQTHQDLLQVSSIGLLNAVNRFDPDRGADFVSFAVPTIMGEVRRHFRDHGWAVKVPRRFKDLQSQLSKARTDLAQQLQRAPTPNDIATHLGIDYELVVEATVVGSHYSTLSADQRGHDEDGLPIQETLGDNDIRLQLVVDIETVRPLIQKLAAREREVLKLRFFDEMTQTQIAQRLGCSQMHVSRLLAKTLETLRDQATAESPGDAVPDSPSNRQAA